MSTYKKYTSSITGHVSASVHTNEEFKWYVGSSTQHTVYFGMEDDDSNFIGKLSNSSYYLSSDTTGCSATVSDIDSTKTAGIIYLNIPQNTSTTSRTIVFKYGTVSLFTVVQDAATQSTKSTITFCIGSFSGNNQIIITWGLTNFTQKNETIACTLHDDYVSTSGELYSDQTINIKSGMGYSYNDAEVYVGHTYWLEGPCIPSSNNLYNFTVSSSKKTYTKDM